MKEKRGDQEPDMNKRRAAIKFALALTLHRAVVVLAWQPLLLHIAGIESPSTRLNPSMIQWKVPPPMNTSRKPAATSIFAALVARSPKKETTMMRQLTQFNISGKKIRPRSASDSACVAPG